MSEKKVVQLGWKEFIAYAEYVFGPFCVWNPTPFFAGQFFHPYMFLSLIFADNNIAH